MDRLSVVESSSAVVAERHGRHLLGKGICAVVSQPVGRQVLQEGAVAVLPKWKEGQQLEEFYGAEFLKAV